MIHAAADTVTDMAKQGPSDFLLYIVYPTIVAGVVATVGYVRAVLKRLTRQDDALATLLREVMPKGQPSLREVVQGNASELALVKQRQGDRWEYVQDALAQLHPGVHIRPSPDGP